ncbi:MAG: enoyl-CoA hydratase/isomerase family protein [Henriciella sp.]
MHALNLDMCEAMTQALLAWQSDPEIECIVVDHAENTRGFCAGGDILMLASSGQGDGQEGAAFFAAEYRLNTVIQEYKKPYVAILDGVTMGGGVGISVHGSHRIATERTVFAMPESGIGLFPDVGGGYFLPRLSGELGLWLALTGARLKGADVLACGVATHFIGSDHLGALVETLCEQGIASLDELQTTAPASFETQRGQMDQHFSAASVEEIMESLSGGESWAREQAEIIATKSPLTCKTAFRQLRSGAQMSFRDVMTMEYRIATRMIQTDNFQEGVRALLIDRDGKPIWNPASLEQVSNALVDSFFAPLADGDLEFLENGT